MHARFCPNCGHPVLPNAKFCGNCGYEFKNNNAANMNRISQSRSRTNRPTIPNQNNYIPRNRPMRKPSHHYGRTIIIAIIVLLLGAGGYMTYQHIMAPNNSNTVTTNSSTPKAISQSTAQNKLDDVWGCAQDKVNQNDDTNSDNESMSDYFTSDTDNNGYNDLYNWAKDMNKADSIDGIDMSVDVKSVKPISSNVSKVKYLVKYTFHNEGDNTHYQGFIWTAKFTKSNGNWLISYNSANNSPVYNHD